MKSTRPTLAAQLVAAKETIKMFEAGGLHTLRAAYHALLKTNKDSLMASGVIVTLTALGGREIVPPFMVADGLSDDTIAALRRDIAETQKDTIRRNEIVEIATKGNQS